MREFKAKCLKIMDEVAKSGDRVVVTKRGVPMVVVGPVVKRPKSIFGADKGKIKILGDIISPIDVEWDAMNRNLARHWIPTKSIQRRNGHANVHRVRI